MKKNKKKKAVSIVLPVFNEETAVGDVIDEIKAVMYNSNYEFEIIGVNDGSTDKTAEIISKKNIKIVDHSYNKGYGASLKTGARKAKYNIVLYIDADGQHKSKDILKLLNYTENYDLVVGARTEESYESILKKIGKFFITKLANYLSEEKIPDLNSGFRAMKKSVIMEFINILPNKFSFTSTITLASLKAGYQIKFVPVKTEKAKSKSEIKPLRDGFNFLILLLRIIMLFNPLRVFIPVSFLFFIIGSVSLIIDIVNFNMTGSTTVSLITACLVFLFGLLADQIANLKIK